VKKLISIFLIVFIVVFSLGGFLIYSAYLSSYKSSYKTFIKKEQSNLYLNKLSINPSELYVNSKTIIWEDGNKEIIKDGNLYDIISVDFENGKVTLTVISDNKELELKKQFTHFFKEDYSQPSNNLAKLLKQFFCLKFLSTIAVAVNSKLFNSTISYTPYFLLKIKSVFLILEVPPPNFTA
jgi:hypothetical protein